MANSTITGLPANTNPSSACIMVVVDPANTSQAPTGTDEQVTLANLATSQNLVKLGGDLAGTTAAPTIGKLQGTTLAAPSGGATRYLNATGTWTVPAGGGGGSSVLDWVSVITYGADPTGVHDSTTAFNGAVGALPAAGGIVYVPAGTYLISGTITLKQSQGMIGDGHVTSILNYTGSSTCIKIANSGTFDGSTEGGWFQGFQVSGTYSGSSQIGCSVADLQGTKMDDVAFYGLGGCALFFTEISGWAEEGHFTKISCIQCGTAGNNATGAVVFSGTSFDYGVYEFTIVTNPGAHGIVLQNGVDMNGCRIAIRGNFYGDTPNTGAVIAIDPGNTSGTSYLMTADLDVSVETAGTGLGHYLLWMGSSNATSQFSGSGILSMFNAFQNGQGILNNDSLPMGFSGICNDGTGNTLQAGDGFTVLGGITSPIQGGLGQALGGTVYAELGSVWMGQLVSGTNAITFDGLEAWGREIDLFLQQPSSGSDGTVTWPSSIKWPSGTAPTLSTANSEVDWIKIKWLGTAVGYGTGVLIAKGYTL